jgi:hypothetical protein
MLQQLIEKLNRLNYKVYTQPYQLNIIGIRSQKTIPNKFNDTLVVFYTTEKMQWHQQKYTLTTYPGTHWLNNPLNTKGTAILKEGQYINSHSIGLHQGKYLALVQVNAVTVYRDNNKNNLPETNSTIEQTGLFGINIHHASKVVISTEINKHSAGCQVLANVKHFNNLMELAQQHKKLYDNLFTYTLIKE